VLRTPDRRTIQAYLPRWMSFNKVKANFKKPSLMRNSSTFKDLKHISFIFQDFSGLENAFYSSTYQVFKDK
jgi:hypothetical protein